MSFNYYVKVFRLAHGPRAQEAFNKMGGKSVIIVQCSYIKYATNRTFKYNCQEKKDNVAVNFLRGQINKAPTVVYENDSK